MKYVIYGSTDRAKLIDYLENTYNTEDGYEQLDDAILHVVGIDPDQIDDSDPEEGMYSSFSTEQLSRIKEYLDNDPVVATIGLTQLQYDVLEELLSDASQDKTKLANIRKAASQLLAKIREV